MLESSLRFLIPKPPMPDNDFLKKLSQQLSALLPMADEIRAEMRTKIEQQLRTSFARLDLLTRSEFDAQARSLQRAEARVQELEQALVALEARLNELEADTDR